jgi:hypothetical protein
MSRKKALLMAPKTPLAGVMVLGVSADCWGAVNTKGGKEIGETDDGCKKKMGAIVHSSPFHPLNQGLHFDINKIDTSLSLKLLLTNLPLNKIAPCDHVLGNMKVSRPHILLRRGRSSYNQRR